MVEIISLSDNINDSKNLLSAEGNALVVSTERGSIVFDVGRFSSVFNHNIAKLGIEAGQLHYVVLSHGHKGHVGAFQGMDFPPNAALVAGSDIWKDKLKTRSQSVFSFRKLWETSQLPMERVRLVEDHMYLLEDTVVAFRTPHLTWPVSWSEKYHVLRPDNTSYTDEFSEELSLCIVTEAGLIVVAGCAHRGIDNIVARAVELTGEERVLMILGGTHIKEDASAFERLCAAVERYRVRYLAPSHCTGVAGLCRLMEKYPEKMITFHTGIKLSVESDGTIVSGRV